METKRFERACPSGYVTARKVREMLGCSSSTLYRIMGEGAFSDKDTILFRGKRIFKEESVRAYFNQYVRACAAK